MIKKYAFLVLMIPTRMGAMEKGSVTVIANPKKVLTVTAYWGDNTWMRYIGNNQCHYFKKSKNGSEFNTVISSDYIINDTEDTYITDCTLCEKLKELANQYDTVTNSNLKCTLFNNNELKITGGYKDFSNVVNGKDDISFIKLSKEVLTAFQKAEKFRDSKK